MLAAIDTHALLEVAYTSIAIVLVVSFAFAVLLYGAVRSADHRRDGSRVAAFGFAVLAALGAATCGAVVAYGFHIIIAK